MRTIAQEPHSQELRSCRHYAHGHIVRVSYGNTEGSYATMTTGVEVEQEGSPPGSAAALIAFLNWAMKKHELVDATASALRTGCIRVLSVEEDLSALDLRTADVDAIVERFRNSNRLKMKPRTIDQYEQRFRQSLDMYLKFLADDPQWKPASRRRARTEAQARTKPASSSQPAATLSNLTQVDLASATSAEVGTIAYPFPVRPGLLARFILPSDLTGQEVDRIVAFISTLAVENGGQRPPASAVD